MLSYTFPALVFGFLFIKKLPQGAAAVSQTRCTSCLLCLFALYGLSIQFDLPWLVLIGLAAIPFGTVALVVFLLANTFVVVKREACRCRICCRACWRFAS